MHGAFHCYYQKLDEDLQARAVDKEEVCRDAIETWLRNPVSSPTIFQSVLSLNRSLIIWSLDIPWRNYLIKRVRRRVFAFTLIYFDELFSRKVFLVQENWPPSFLHVEMGKRRSFRVLELALGADTMAAQERHSRDIVQSR